MTSLSFSPIRNSFRQLVSKILFCCCLLVINLQLKAQVIKIPAPTSSSYYLSVCNGGYVEIHIVNTGAAIASPIYLTTDFGSNFDDLSFVTNSLGSAKLYSTNTAISFVTGTSGSQKYYKFSTALAAHDSIQLKVYLRPVCGYLNSQPIASPPLPVTASHVFNLSLFSGAITGTPLYAIGISPSIRITYPKVDVYCRYQSALPTFLPAQTDLNIGATGGCQGYYEYKTPLTVFYKYVRLLNSPTADTLDLTNPAAFLKVHDKRIDKNIQYRIKAIHVKSSSSPTGFYRIAANTTVSNPNPISSYSTTPISPQTFVLKSKTTSSEIQDTIVLNGSIFQLAKGTKKLAPNDTLVFWEECEMLPKNTTTHVNENICSKTTQTDYETEYNCTYKILAGDSITSCYTNTVNDCNQIHFQPHAPSLAYKSGYLRQDLCYNYQQDTTNANFRSNTNLYYLIVGNTGNSTAAHLKVELAVRDTAPQTKYILNKATLLNAHFGVVTFTSFSAVTASLAGATMVSNLRLKYNHFVGAIPGIADVGSYYCIDSLKSSTGDSITLQPNQALIMIWEGYHSLPECGDINLDSWASRVTTYDSCSQSIVTYGSSTNWSTGSPMNAPNNFYNNQSAYYSFISLPPSTVSSNQIQGAGLTQVIGVTDDDYSAAPVGTLKFTLPTFTNKKLLPSNSSTLNQSIAVKIDIGALLNVWKGDEYNVNVPCTRPDSCGNYDKKHLTKYVRFYVDTSNGGIIPRYKRVYANCIGYVNTGVGSYHHYDSIGRPTALNGITDEILAWFDFSSGFNVNWLKRMYVEVDVQPACAHCACSRQPYNGFNSAYIAIASQMTGSSTPVSMTVYHIPDEGCGYDTIGITTSQTTPCFIPKNRYCIFNGGSPVIVQCPGCHISGLYSIKAIGSRINFGYPDFDNNGVADNQQHILFNQVHFKTNITAPFTSVDASNIMYHDLFRVRHQSIVHLDDTVYSNYYPTAATLGMPLSTSHPHEKGYTIGYVRVTTSDSIAVFNYKNPTDSIHLQNNIPALIVWINDGNTANTASYPYRSGFNAYHPNTSLFPYQTYSISSTQIDTVTPILIFYDPSRDFRDNTSSPKHEFVYDISLSRLDSAYRKQYDSTKHLPFDYFHDKMKLDFDMTYTLNQNPAAGSSSVVIQQEPIVTKAYFTFTRETPANYASFFDIQDAQNQPLRNDTTPKVFVSTPALLDSLCPMSSSPYPVLINGSPKNNCDSVRWYCVKGEADFNRIGFLFQPTAFNDPDYYHTYSMNFCGFSILGNREFFIGRSNSNNNVTGLNTVTQFNNEYRNWSNCKRFEITGLPYGSLITATTAASYNTYFNAAYAHAVPLIHKPIPMNGVTHSWIIDFDSLIAPSTYKPVTSIQDSIQRSDDDETNGFGISVQYPLCRDSTYCMKIREIDEFNICDLNTINTTNIYQTVCDTSHTSLVLTSSNYVNGFGIPLNSTYQSCANERYFEQSVHFKAIKNKDRLYGTSKTAMLDNGHICWDSIVVIQDTTDASNPWVTVQFPPSWHDTTFTVTSITNSVRYGGNNYTYTFPTAPSGVINGVHTPRYMGNHTWLFYAPTASTNAVWKAGCINYLSICATYDCNNPPSDNNVEVNGGILCDTASFRTIDSIPQLYAMSCERMTDTIFLSSTKPEIGVSENTNNFSGAGLCSDFNMGYTIRNEGNECLKNVSIKINIPTTSSFSLTQATGYAGMPTAKNAVLIYKGVKKFFTIHTGMNILDSLKSSFCSNTGASLPGSHMNTTDPDSVMIVFGIHADCHLSYDLIYDTVYGYNTCGGNLYFVSPAPVPFATNPILSSPTNIYNQLQPSFLINPLFSNSCEVPDSIELDLSSILPSGSTGYSTLNGLNKVLLKIPKGVHLSSATFHNANLPIANYQNCSICKQTALASVCDSLKDSTYVYSIDLASLNGTSLILNNPLNLQIHFTLDSSVACSSKWNAVVVTSSQVICNSTNCSFCAAQTSKASIQMLLNASVPTLSSYTTPCTGKGMFTAANGCKFIHWLVNNQNYYSSNDTLLINTAGNYNAVGFSTLFKHGVCQSDTSLSTPLVITPKVAITISKITAPCTLQSNGQISIHISSGTKPYSVSFNGSTSPPDTTTNYTFSNLSAGIYPISVTDSMGCILYDTINLPTSAICGDRNVCMGAISTYFINTNVATQFNWTVGGGSIQSNTPQYQVVVQWNKLGIDTLYLRGLNASNAVVLNDTVLVNVTPKPNPIIGLMGGWNSCYKVTPEMVGGNVVGYDTCYQFCIHSALKFTTPKVSGHTYQWTTTHCHVIGGLNRDTITILFDSLGSGGITLVESDTITHCVTTVNKCFYIIAKPIAKAICLNYPIASGIIQVCNAVTLNFSDTSSPALSLINRQWNFGDGSPIVNTTNTLVNHTYTTGGTYHLTLTVENTCHCTDTFKVTVIVNTMPGVPVLCSTTKCYNDTSTYYTTAISCSSYSWTVANGTIIGSNTSPSVKIKWNGASSNPIGQIGLTVSGCAAYCSLPTNIVVPIVTPTSKITCPLAICQNDKIMVSVPAVAGNTYTWSTSTSSYVQFQGSKYKNEVWIKAIGNVGNVIHLRVDYYDCTIGCSGHADTTITIRGTYAVKCYNNTSCNKFCPQTSGTFVTDYFATDSTQKFKWNCVYAGTGISYTSSITKTSKFSINFPTVSVPTIFWIYAHDTIAGQFCNTSDPYYEVTVYPKPLKPTISQILKDSCICPNSTLVMIGKPSPFSPNNYFSWSTTNSGVNPQSGIGNTFSTYITSTAPYTFAVRQIMGEEPHCQSDTMQFKVLNCHAPTLTIHGDSFVCSNCVTHLYAKQGFDTYNWALKNNADGTILSGQGTNSIAVQWNKTQTNYHATSNPNIVLQTKFCSTSYSKNYIVDIDTPSNITITASTTLFCTGKSVTFTTNSVSSTPCGLTGNFTWNFGDGTPTVTTSNHQANHTYAIAGTYTITVAAQNSSSSHILKTASTSVTVGLTPSVSLKATDSICPIGVLRAHVTNPASGTFTYQYLNPTFVVVTHSGVASTYDSVHHYSTALNGNDVIVKVTGSNGCVAQSQQQSLCASPPQGGSTPANYGYLTYTLQSCTGNVSVVLHVNGNIPSSYLPSQKFEIDFGDNTPHTIVTIPPYYYSAPFTSTAFTHTYTNVGKFDVAVWMTGGATHRVATFDKTIEVPIIPDFKVLNYCNTSNAKQSQVLDLNKVYHTPKTVTWSGALTTTSPTSLSVGSYTETMTVKDAASPQNTCTLTKTFVVPAAPTVSISDTPWVNQCELTPILFKPITTSNILGLEWSFTDYISTPFLNRFYSNLKNPKEAFHYRTNIGQAGKVDVTLFIVDTMLCKSTTTNFTDTTKQNTLNAFSVNPVVAASAAHFNTTNMHVNCINVGDTFKVIVDTFTGNGGRSHPPFSFTWHTGLPSFTSNTITSNVVAYQPGNYWVTVTDANGCVGNSITNVSPHFIQTPTPIIVGKTDVCSGDASDYSFSIGSSFVYKWYLYKHGSFSPIDSGSTGNIHIAAGKLLSAHSPYAIIATIKNATGGTCPNLDSFKIIAHTLPVAAIPSLTPSTYCLHGNNAVTVTANATGGKTPYTYYWMDGTWGTGLSQTTVLHGGQYGYHVVDSFGCSSGVGYVNINPPADFTGLLTGCLTLCDTEKLCPATDNNYPNISWLLNGSPVSSGAITSNGSLMPPISGDYQEVLCNNNCCDTSAIVSLQVIPCSYCCQADVFNIDSIFCIGKDRAGNMQYQFRLRITHNCPSLAMLQMYVGSGSVNSFSTTTVVPGNNTIWGIYVNSGAQTQFCSTITISGTDTCAHDIPCVNLPTNCTSVSACNTRMNYKIDQCIGVDANGNPMYLIYIDVTNNYSTPLDDTLYSYQGIVTHNIITGIPPTSTISVPIVFTDTLPFDGYICLYGKAVDPTTGLPCQSVICFALQSSNNCIQSSGCSFDGCIEGISCIGYDTLGYPIYQVNVQFNNPFGYDPDAIFSVVTTAGLITNITPLTPIAGANLTTFQFTDYSMVDKLCLQLIVTDTMKHYNCTIDYTQLECLCWQLPDCPQDRRALPNKNNSSANSTKTDATTCMVKVVPNPNEGKPEIYYKLSSDNLTDNSSLDNLKIRIVESSSGKIVAVLPLEKPAGVLYWGSSNPLPQGHYVVVLQQGNKTLCEAKMEVVKQ